MRDLKRGVVDVVVVIPDNAMETIQNNQQAVQYAMFLLLGSVFFSGFFLDLRNLREPVRAISWALPATYGIKMLQNTALRGSSINILVLSILLAIGLGLFVISWVLLRRRLKQ